MDRSRTIWAFRDFELDEALWELRRSGQHLELQPKPLQLLFFLLHNRDRVVSKSEILDEVWADAIVSETALTSALRDVRRVLGPEPPDDPLIETIRGRGYRFRARVVEAVPESIAEAPGDRSFVGRAEVLEQIHAALDEAAQGRSRIVLVCGEPGIGKTRTAERFAERARVSGATVAQGWCYEGEGAPPFWPWKHALRAVLDSTGVESVRSDLGPSADDLGQIVELDGSAKPAADPNLSPEEARFRLFQSVSAFLTWAGAREPVAIVLDDLHHADASSLRLLEFLARELARSRVLILATYRDVPSRSSLVETVAELARHDLCRRVSLEGLEAEEIRELVPALTGQPAPAEFVNALVEKTDGNPFFIKELVQLARAEGAELPTSLEVPRGLREVIRGRLQQLSSTCNRVLAAASVMGPDLDLDTLARVTGVEAAALEDALESAREAAIVAATPEGGYRFAHALLQETVYAEQSPAQRVNLHRRVGEALETTPGTANDAQVGELAHHFSQGAATGGADKAVDYAVRAGRRAMAVLAFEEAADQYERALELKVTADARSRSDLLLALGDARASSGDRLGAKQAFVDVAEVARGLKDGERLARAAYGFAGRPTQFDVDAEAVEFLEEALGALEPGDTPLRVKLLVRLAGHVFAPSGVERAHELVNEAMASAENLADPGLRAIALDIADWILWGRATPEERYRSAVDCLRCAEEVGDQTIAAQAQLHQIRSHLELGDLPAADREFAVFDRRVAEQRVLTLEHQAIGYGAMKALLAGDFSGGEALTFEALDRARRNQHAPGEIVATFRLGVVRREQGRLSEILEMARALAAQNPGILGVRCAVALLLVEVDEREMAREELEELLHQQPAALASGPEWIVSAALLAEVSHRLGALNAAETLYQLLLPCARWNVILGDGQLYFGSTAHYLGLLSHTLGRPGDAADHFSAALAMHEKMGAIPWLARTQHAFAAMLVDRGDAAVWPEVRGLLGEARQLAHQLDMSALESRCADLAMRLNSAR